MKKITQIAVHSHFLKHTYQLKSNQTANINFYFTEFLNIYC